MYLRFPGGNCGLSVCSVRVSDGERERASKHVSKSVSMQRVEQLNSVLNPRAPRRGQLSPVLRQKERQPSFFLPSLSNRLFVRLILIFPSFCSGCLPHRMSCFRIPQGFGPFLKSLDATLVFSF